APKRGYLERPGLPVASTFAQGAANLGEIGAQGLDAARVEYDSAIEERAAGTFVKMLKRGGDIGIAGNAQLKGRDRSESASHGAALQAVVANPVRMDRGAERADEVLVAQVNEFGRRRALDAGVEVNSPVGFM